MNWKDLNKKELDLYFKVPNSSKYWSVSKGGKRKKADTGIEALMYFATDSFTLNVASAAVDSF